MDIGTNLSSHSLTGLCEYEIIGNMVIGLLSLNLLLIVMFVFILYVGYTQKKKHQSPPSHSDVFTYNLIAMEIMTVIGCCSYLTEVKTGVSDPTAKSFLRSGVIGQMCFHCLSCVDRYLAVAHPITYMRLKERGGVKIRNIVVASAWVICVGLKNVFFMIFQEVDGRLFELILASFFFVAVAFCSVSVICVLMRPGPGEGDGDLRRIDQSKQRAFVIIMVITGALFVKFVIFFLDYIMVLLKFIDQYNSCLFSISAVFLNLPSALLSPIMFLQKYGKLPKCSVRNCRLQLKYK